MHDPGLPDSDAARTGVRPAVVALYSVRRHRGALSFYQDF